MADRNKGSQGMDELKDQSQGQTGTGNLSEDSTVSETGQKGGQASRQTEDTSEFDQETENETEMDEDLPRAG